MRHEIHVWDAQGLFALVQIPLRPAATGEVRIKRILFSSSGYNFLIFRHASILNSAHPDAVCLTGRSPSRDMPPLQEQEAKLMLLSKENQHESESITNLNHADICRRTPRHDNTAKRKNRKNMRGLAVASPHVITRRPTSYHPQPHTSPSAIPHFMLAAPTRCGACSVASRRAYQHAGEILPKAERMAVLPPPPP